MLVEISDVAQALSALHLQVQLMLDPLAIAKLRAQMPAREFDIRIAELDVVAGDLPFPWVGHA